MKKLLTLMGLALIFISMIGCSSLRKAELASGNDPDKAVAEVTQIMEAAQKDQIDVLADECGFSGPKLRRIISNLEEKGIIWGYHAVTDFDKIELNEYILLVKKTNKPLDELADKIINRDIEKLSDKMGIIIGSSY